MSEKRKRSSGYYARIMGTFWRHPRTRSLSFSARGLWVSLLSWSADQRSDGHVDLAGLAMVTTGHKDAKSAIAELTESGLLVEDNGYQIRSWAKHNTTRADHDAYKEQKKNEVNARRASDKERRAPVPGSVPGSVPRNTSGTSQEPNEEQTGNPHVHVLSLSSEGESEGGRPKRLGWDLSSYEKLIELVRSRLHEHYLRARGSTPPPALDRSDTREVGEIARWVRSESERSKCTVEDVVERMAARWAQSKTRQGDPVPLAWLAKNPGEYLPARTAASAELPADLHDIERLALSRAAEGRGWGSASKLERAWQGLLERHPALMASRKHPGHAEAAA